MPKLIDLTGQRFGRLTVLERDQDEGKTQNGNVCAIAGARLAF